MSDYTVKEYAKEILKSHGCDCYTYWGEREHIMNDLKQAYPDGMKFPYVDVANAILEMSKPIPIERSPWRMVWDNDNCYDGIYCESFEEAKCCALNTLLEWEMEFFEENDSFPINIKEWTEEQKEDWDYMIYNCSVSINKYNPFTDEYEEYWNPSYEDEKDAGWMVCEELVTNNIYV